MTLEQLSFIAGIIGSLGVIIPLLFVGLELRKNTAQGKLSNDGDVVDRFMSPYAMTNDLSLDALVAKGGKSHTSLSDEEKISFGHYLENIRIALESLLQYDMTDMRRVGDSQCLFDKHVRYHLSLPGERGWFNAFEEERGFPPLFMQPFIGH